MGPPYLRGTLSRKPGAVQVLHDMDITDKHRLLMVVVANASLGTLRFNADANPEVVEIVGFSEPKWPARPSEDGTEIFRIKFGKPAPYVKVESNPIVQIAFEHYGPLTKQPALHCVNQLRKVTEGTITKFVQELKRAK